MAYCDEYVELISANLDGALSPAEREKLEAHLASCPECKALYEELTAVHTALEDLPPIEVPAGLTDRIMAAVAAEQVIPFVSAEKKKAPRPWRKWLASAAVLAVVVAGTWSWKPWEHSAAGELKPKSAAPAVQQNMTTDSSEALPEASEAVEAATESVLLYTADSEAPDSANEPAAPVLPASGKTSAAKIAGAVQDTALPVYNGNDAPAEAPEETGKIAPQMSRMMPEPESVVNGGDGGVEPALPTDTPEETDTEETALDAQPFVMMAASTPMEVADGEKILTAREALDRLLEEYPMPEDAALIDTEDFLGWETPLVPVGGDPDPDGQQVSTRLEYLGVTANGKYYEFWLYSFLLDIPSEGLAHSSTLNFLAVPLDSGEILEQRRPEGDLRAQEAWDAYQASIDTYNEAISK